MNFLFNRLERRGLNKYLRERITRYIKDIIIFLRETKLKSSDVEKEKNIL